MSDNRLITGWTKKYPFKKPIRGIVTSRPFIEEYFSALRYFSEIEEKGYEFIKSFGFESDEKIEEVFKIFQAFIRQGITFYKSAENLPHRASPLFYYYSFLNFAKAYLCLYNPEKYSKRINHGLTLNKITREALFESQTVDVKNGVFKELYKNLFGVSIKQNTQLNITDLFCYIPDISYELMKVGYGQPNYIPCQMAFCINEIEKKSWFLLALHGHGKLEDYSQYFSYFFNNFTETSPDKTMVKQIYDIDASVYKEYKFYQSIEMFDIINITKKLNEFITNMQEKTNPVLYSRGGYDFNIFLPLKTTTNSIMPFNDILATYVIMFYLGSLVRYTPYYLEKLISSKHSWIVEQFVNSANVLFLRTITNIIIPEGIICQHT